MTNNITFYDRQYNMISGELLFSDHSVLQASVKHFQEYITEMKVEHTIIPFTDCENINCMHSTWKGVKAPNIMVVQSVDH